MSPRDLDPFLPEAKPTGLVETMSSVRACQFDVRGVMKSADVPHLTTCDLMNLG